MDSRRLSAVALLTLILVGAGCVGFLLGDEPQTFEASNATVSEAALEETGYQSQGIERSVVTRNFSVADRNRTVEVINYAAQYHRTIELPVIGRHPAAVFTAYSTPQVEVLDRTFNPVGDMSNRELVETVQSQYSSVTVHEEVESVNRTVLGKTANVTKYAGSAELQGGVEVDVYIHVTQIAHEGDFVVAVGVYPQRLDSGEENFYTLLDGLEH